MIDSKVVLFHKEKQSYIFGNKTMVDTPAHARVFDNRKMAINHINDWFGWAPEEFEIQLVLDGVQFKKIYLLDSKHKKYPGVQIGLGNLAKIFEFVIPADAEQAFKMLQEFAK